MTSTSTGLRAIEYLLYAAAVVIWMIAIIAYFDVTALPFAVTVSGSGPPRIGLLANALASAGIAIGYGRQGRRKHVLLFASLTLLWALLSLPL
ncbi:hypothetical protein [Phreatobacter sp. AB_2022a]|uniref:hypothetical protein n=1 Tax=Phreatobacter sp. AB_2022a TaxID=3003134 RepID=UPI00228721A9|nr:hypothetical protein [Phreatobacter sp. AB_2022a]MCZ0735689.1 hypothetical protein [Phreatobacter sp. AB_2022a]